jgi:DNA-binding GntR family transcriptional regulator
VEEEVDRHQLETAIAGTPAGRRLVHHPSLTSDVYEVVMDMLIDHTLAPGTRLNIDGLARHLGISPTPVREALARIESEGMIIKEPRRGYTVAPQIGRDALVQLIELRLLIEPATAAAAAERSTQAQATSLRAFARSGGAGKSGAGANRLDMTYDAQFHDLIAQLSGNQYIRETLGRLRSHLHMYRLHHHAGQAAATKPEHVAIARAIAGGDPEAAAEAMRTHLQTALNRLEAVFAIQRPSAAKDHPRAPV